MKHRGIPSEKRSQSWVTGSMDTSEIRVKKGGKSMIHMRRSRREEDCWQREGGWETALLMRVVTGMSGEFGTT